MALSRIQIPKEVRKGELVEVRILIQHAMETGYRRDVNGAPVPRNAIRSFTCKYSGAEVFRATLSPGIAANPVLRFFFRAVDSGELDFWWRDDDGAEGSAKAKLVVA